MTGSDFSGIWFLFITRPAFWRTSILHLRAAPNWVQIGCKLKQWNSEIKFLFTFDISKKGMCFQYTLRFQIFYHCLCCRREGIYMVLKMQWSVPLQVKLCYFSCYTNNRNWLRYCNFHEFAGAITGAITTPLDVVKTRLMIQVHFHSILNPPKHKFTILSSRNVQGSAKQYDGMYHCVETIIREEGSSAFLRVLWPSTHHAFLLLIKTFIFLYIRVNIQTVTPPCLDCRVFRGWGLEWCG